MNNKTNKEWEEKIDNWFPRNADRIFVKKGIHSLLFSERQRLRKEIEKIDILPCLCNKNPFDKLCEYNKGFQKAIDGIINLLEE